MGNRCGPERAKTRRRKGVQAGFNPTFTMGGKGGELNVISAWGLKLIDRVWYDAIYYIAYSNNPTGINYQCNLSLHSKTCSVKQLWNTHGKALIVTSHNEKPNCACPEFDSKSSKHWLWCHVAKKSICACPESAIQTNRDFSWPIC